MAAGENKQIQGLERINVTQLRGVGDRLAEKLGRLDIYNLQDLVFHLPSRYQDRTRFQPLGTLVNGAEALVQGEVLLSQVRFGRRRSLLVRVSDGTGSLTIRLFHFSKSQEQGFRRGTFIRCYGEVRRGAESLEMVHPEYSLSDEPFSEPLEQYLTPVYPSVEGIGQKAWHNMIQQTLLQLKQVPDMLKDWLPEQCVEGDLVEAIEALHRPQVSCADDMAREARQRLAFEELLAHHLSLRRIRMRNQLLQALVFDSQPNKIEQFLANLPFELTSAQKRVDRQVSKNLEQGYPMMRLVQGDVGSGKTVVAALAALRAVESGAQVAIMAPTEILAEQHRQVFQDWMSPLGIDVVWLSGSQKVKERNESMTAIQAGAAITVGTHALFQDGVEFPALGLVIVDEQHRFGVHQRLALRNKGRHDGFVPHQLVMTATPIPRTLAMTVYADLDVSVIDELPKGRQAIDTVVIPVQRRLEVMQRVGQACAQGRQVYWVCPLIEESEVLEAQAATEAFEQFTQAYPGLRVGLVHGRLKSAEKELVMSTFKAGELDLLVATTVIEVGVDVPGASLMVIENAERLGLSQLHQLRGRVGRGSEKSDCVLMYKSPLSEIGKQRLNVMRESQDGFVIAQKDLELRGPGELLGTRQTGMFAFKVADIIKDQPLLERVDQVAELLVEKFPQNIAPLVRRWVGHSLKYSDA